MAGCKKKARSDQSSIEYRSNPAKLASFDFVHQECAPALSDGDKQINKKYEPKSNKPLSTKELIAAVGELWDSANRLPLFHPKANPTGNHSGCKKEILANLDKEGSSQLPLSVGSKYFCIDISGGDQFSHTVQPNLEFFKLNQKMSVFESCSKKYSHSALLRFLQGGATLTYDIGNRGLASVGISHESGNIYPWMTETASAGVRYPKGIPEIEKREVGDHYIPGDLTDCSGSFISGDTHSPACNLVAKDANVSLGLIKSKDQSSCVSTELVMNTGITRSLLSDYFLKDVSAMKGDCNMTSRPHSSLYDDYCINSLASSNGSYEKCHHLIQDDELLENKREQPEKCVIEDTSKMAFHTLKNEKPQFGLAKQEHAAAGALAGIFVSFCLHPVDTIKTVIQSCRAERKSIFHIGRSIVSERGLSGLYRGIASNIASSAPTSAVYTFTYESVKGALLPHFPREFHSLAHCMAGGCASVATSFIFTPSERIKQQMQVGSHYRNCWNALVGIIKKGGLPSLYAGWGAVLCRNVPHSIIKFYTYESLKKMMLPSSNSAAQPNTKQTLVCGGLAGSTAALFTTPFDVVKTRLQTQIPGSRSRYHSVYHALQEIGKQEGLKGLYRGLIPRLVMYMSQGAIFFTSYEFFKRLLSLDVPQLNSRRIQFNQNKEGDPGSSQSPFPSPSSTSAAALSPSRPSLHSSHS